RIGLKPGSTASYAADCGTKWQQKFTYDAVGNLTKSGSLSFSPTYDLTTNRYIALPGFTPTYDSNGDLLTDSFHTYQWDGDGHMANIDAVQVTYDALGRVAEFYDSA